MALITAAEARLYLPGLTGTDEDTELDTLITRAGVWIAYWLGYEAATTGGEPSLEVTSYTEFLEGPGGRRLQLPYYPITTVTLIEDDPNEDFDGSTEVVATTEFDVRRNEGILLLKQDSTQGAWSKTCNEVIKAQWDAGYSSIPEAIQQACVQLVSYWWKQRGTFGQTSLTIALTGSSASPRAEEVPGSVTELLRPFRLVAGVLP